jgi:hypothetical protein
MTLDEAIKVRLPVEMIAYGGMLVARKTHPTPASCRLLNAISENCRCTGEAFEISHLICNSQVF